MLTEHYACRGKVGTHRAPYGGYIFLAVGLEQFANGKGAQRCRTTLAVSRGFRG